MSPILVRPVREQLEHDRVIRILQAKFRRRFDVGINPGSEQNAAVGSGPTAVYPDVVLTSPDRGRKIVTVIEVETVESVNNLEALAEWVPFGRLKSAFHLYVPAVMVDVARRLCTDSQIPVAEIHTYHWIGDEMRFLPAYRAPADGHGASRPGSGQAAARRPAAKSAAPAKRKPAKALRPGSGQAAGKRPAKKAAKSTKRK